MINIDYKILPFDQENNKQDNCKIVIMLNINTFKLFCLEANTCEANEFNKYFMKLEELLYDVVEKENDQLNLQLTGLLYNIDSKFIYDNPIIETNNKTLKDKQQSLLYEVGSMSSIIYIFKIKSYSSSKYIIKLGESKYGIEAVINKYKTKYIEILLLDCFKVLKSEEFIVFLYNNEYIKNNKIINIEGYENEIDLFLIGNNLSYDALLFIINTNIKYYNKYSHYEINQLENNLLKQNITKILPDQKSIQFSNDILIKELINSNKMLVNKVKTLEKNILEKLNSININCITHFQEKNKNKVYPFLS
jgi:hypothetical protein